MIDQARFGWAEDEAATYDAAHDCAARALLADPDCGDAYMIKGYAWTFQRRHDEAIAAGERAIALSPNSTDVYHTAGMYHGYAGNFRKAAAYEEQAQRLSPINRVESMVDEARAKYHMGNFISARDITLRVLKTNPRWLTAQTLLVATLWSHGSIEEARSVAQKMLASHSNFSVSRWARRLPYRRPEDLEALVNPLRMAGLPE